MSSLKFNITLESLKLYQWDRWEDLDRDWILKAVKNNHLTTTENEYGDELEISGKQENLFFFLKDVSYRYDIEII